jgi:peptide/nickel transport system ATP-binding protein
MTDALVVEDMRVEIATASGPIKPVRGVSVAVTRGETFALVGESGCGKSVTALALMRLIPRNASLTASRLLQGGHDLMAMTPRELTRMRGSRVAMVSQDPMTALNPSFTIGNQLVEVLRRHRAMSRRDARDRAVDLMTRVGIASAGDRLGQYPHQLSGGLRQRIVIAMALLCGPELLIADEPTTALDVTIQAQILILLKEMQAEFGMTLVLITHDLGVVASVADRVAVMYAGQIVETGTVADVLGAPLHPYTEGLLRSVPTPESRRPGEFLGTIPGMVPRPIGELSACGFGNRCPYAAAACHHEAIALRAVADQRQYRCVLPPDPAARDTSAWLRQAEALS